MANSDASAASVQWLQNCGLPEPLWDRLLSKIHDGVVGTGEALQASAEEGLCKVTANHSITAGSDVWLVPHLVNATRPALHAALVGIKEPTPLCAGDFEMSGVCRELLRADPVDDGVRLLSRFFGWAKPTPVSPHAGQRDYTEWHLAAREALWLRHGEQPHVGGAPSVCAGSGNAAGTSSVYHLVALPGELVVGIGAEDGETAPRGASIVWPLLSLQAGDEVTRDWLPGSRSLQRGAALLALLADSANIAPPRAAPRRWAHYEEHDALAAAVAAATSGQLPPGLVLEGGLLPAPPPSDTRLSIQLESHTASRPIKLRLEYPHVREHLTRPGFELVSPEEAATSDVLFASNPMRDFYALPRHQVVNQFPYEGCIVRKDLLPQTARRLLRSCLRATSDRLPAISASWHPAWLPATYDLSTEIHFFLEDYRARAAEGADNHWVVKLAQGARSSDVCLTDDALTVVAYRAAPWDRVAQSYIADPVLWKGRKFDLRLYVAVHSFHPLRAWLFDGWYGRVANKAYTLTPLNQCDFETHFTVVCYDDDQDVARSKGDLLPELEAQGVDMAALEVELMGLSRQLLQAAATQIGEWPQSRAIYGLDVMMAKLPCSYTSAGAQSPACDVAAGCRLQLLEVNSCPDFGLVSHMQPHFLNDVFTALFTDESTPTSLWQL